MVPRNAKEVCGLRILSEGRGRKGSDWWNNEAKQLVRERKQAHIRCLHGEYTTERVKK